MRIVRHLDQTMPRRPQLTGRATLGAVIALTFLTAPQTGCLPAEADVSGEDTEESLSALDQLDVAVDEVDSEELSADELSEAELSDEASDGDVDHTAGPEAVGATLITKLRVANPSGVARKGEPVRVGVPLPKSANITNLSSLTLYDPSGQPIAAQATALARWGSTPGNTAAPIRWALLSFQATVGGSTNVEYGLYRDGSNPAAAAALTVTDNGTAIAISTGPAVFNLSRASADLFTSVTVNGSNLLKAGNGIVLKDKSGATYKADLTKASVTVESKGKNDAVIKVTGSHVKTGSTTTLLNYTLRMTFFAGRSDIRMSYTLHNPAAAKHDSNVWPLGDTQGSRYIEDVSLVLPLNSSSTPSYLLSAGSNFSGSASQEIKVYQDSSGGSNYKSANHMNASRWVPITFKGFKATAGSSTLTTGTRVQPWLDISGSSGGISVGVRQFWQNFPKALAYSSSAVRVGLFPTEFADAYEIQGGEQKTHELSVYFHTGAGSASTIAPIMEAMQVPLVVSASSASWYQTSGGLFWEESTRQGLKGTDGTLEATMDTVVYKRGSVARSMVSQWEIIDEFGWRNYGDVMADHETDCGLDNLDTPISHYNNQYDYAYGALSMFFRTLDPAYLEFSYAAARHTMDVDINHTTQDWSAYAGGMFWHTTHNIKADTSSHRAYPLEEVSSACTQWTAGGPSLGHIYLDGMLGYYFMTGDPIARDSVIEVANFAIVRHQQYGDEVEGRPYGNYLQALVQAYRLTGDAKYYNAASSFLWNAGSAYISMVSGTEFKDAIFGKGLARFLDMKAELGQTTDGDYNKAKSLFQTLADKVYSATQSNDINATRWSDVMAYAYKHLGKNTKYLDKSKKLYSNLESSYWARGTYSHAKELTILLNNGHMVRYYRQQGL